MIIDSPNSTVRGVNGKRVADARYFSDLNLLKEPLLVILIGLNDKGLTQKLGLHRRNFIRLVDKAIIEYLDARQDW